MILRGIIRGIMFIVDGFAKIIAWLLIALGLWLPALFTFIYFITCAITHIKIVGNVVTLYFVGLALSCLGSLGLSLHKINKSKKKKDSQTNVNITKVVKKEKFKASFTEADEEFEEHYDSDYEENASDLSTEENAQSKSAVRKNRRSEQEDIESKERLIKEQEAERERADEREWQREQELKREVAKERERTINGNLPQNKEHLSGFADSSEVKVKKEKRRVVTESEMPRVFALKRDPTVFVHEYSDRLLFYRRTRKGMEHFKTEYKGE